MKKLIVILLAATALASCSKECNQPSGDIQTTIRTEPPFMGVSLQYSSDVEVLYDSIQYIEIIAPKGVEEYITTDVRGSILEVDSKSRCNLSDLNVMVKVHTPRLSELAVRGSGDLYTYGVFEDEEIKLIVDGSGDLDANVQSTRVNLIINGSGKLSVTGSADVMDILVDGSGSIKAFGLITDQASIDVGGSGTSEVFVNQSLAVEIGGSGDVFYKGTPNISVQNNGSGQLINAN